VAVLIKSPDQAIKLCRRIQTPALRAWSSTEAFLIASPLPAPVDKWPFRPYRSKVARIEQ
jgi:hypothetical protein